MAAGVKISVRHELRALSRDLKRVHRKHVEPAARAALNRTGGSVRSVAVKEVARESGIKQKDVRGAVKLDKARKGGPLRAEIQGRGRPLNLIRFAARQLKKGVSAKPWNKKRVYGRGAFIDNDGRTVFKRTGAGRLPIRGMYGASIATELVRDAVAAAVRKQFGERWPVEFKRAFEQAMKRGLPRRKS